MELTFCSYNNALQWADSRATFTSRRGLILELSDGVFRGRGDCAPLSGWSQETLRDIARDAGALTVSMAESSSPESVDGIGPWLDELAVLLGAALAPSLRHGLEQAALELLAARAGASVKKLLAEHFAVDTDASFPRHIVARDAEDAARALERGISTLKLKIGDRPLEETSKWIGRIRDSAPNATLRADANGSIPLSDGLAWLQMLDAHRIDSVEDLVPGGAFALKRFRGATRVKILADHPSKNAAAIDELIALDAVDGIVLKPMRLGGPLRTIEIARKIHAAGMHFQITTLLESSLGRNAAALACAAAPKSSQLSAGVDRIAASCGPANIVADQRVQMPFESAAVLGSGVLSDSERALSWAQAMKEIEKRSGGLAKAGVVRGTRIAIAPPLSLEGAFQIYAALHRGAVPVLVESETMSEQLVRRGTADTSWARATVRSRVAAAPEEDAADYSLRDEIAVVFTSGSSGTPKEVALSMRQVMMSALGSAARTGHDATSRMWGSLPLYHVGGLSLLFRALFCGASLHLSRFNARAFADACAEGTLSHASVVPVMLSDILEQLGERPVHSNVRALLCGGAKLPADLHGLAIAKGLPVAETWGMSETASQIATAAPGHTGMAPLFPARVIAGTPATVIGPMAPLGAHRTSDRVVEVDATNSESRAGLRVLGRVDAVIISGGKNISPEEVERAMCEIPGISAALVVGIPDARWGQRPYALFCGTLTPAALAEALEKNLPKVQIPDAFYLVDSLPRTELGKPSRAGALREVLRRRNARPRGSTPTGTATQVLRRPSTAHSTQPISRDVSVPTPSPRSSLSARPDALSPSCSKGERS